MLSCHLLLRYQNRIWIQLSSASVFTGVLATFGVQTSKKGAQSGGGASGGVSKADMEKLIAAASQTAPAQTIRIEQAPVKITPETK